jgi:hypothetical protein
MAGERRKKLILTGISVLVTLLFAEAALRILGIGAIGRGSPWFAGGNHPRFLFQPDPESGYTLRPGFHGREIAPGGEFDVPVTIDERGLRDHRHVTAPRPVVLALGDSMTFGEGVPEDRTWSANLETASGFRVENGGVPGFSSRQMEGRARELIPRLHPDLVLVTVSPRWDHQRCAAPFTYLGGYIVAQGYLGRLHLIDGDLYLAETRLPVLGPFSAYLKRYSYLARLALPPLGNAARAATRGEPLASAEDYTPTADALAGIREQAGEAGAGFLAILIESRGREYEADRDGLEKILKARSIPFLSLDAFLARADWPRLRYARDQHWNEAGHRTVGTALAPVVRPLIAKR